MKTLSEIVNDFDNAFALYMVLQADPDPTVLSEFGKILDDLKELQNAKTTPRGKRRKDIDRLHHGGKSTGDV